MNEKQHNNSTITDPSWSGRFKEWLIENFGPTPSGARHWFVGAVVAFSILSFCPGLPFALIIVLKTSTLITLLLSVLAVAKGLWDGYTKRNAKHHDYSVFGYIGEDLIGNWLNNWPNRIRLIFGAVFFAAVLTLLICVFPGVDTLASYAMPGLQPLFDWAGSVVHFVSNDLLTVFSEILTETTAPIVASAFLMILVLSTYDAFCAAIQWVFPIEEENVHPAGPPDNGTTFPLQPVPNQANQTNNQGNQFGGVLNKNPITGIDSDSDSLTVEDSDEPSDKLLNKGTP